MKLSYLLNEEIISSNSVIGYHASDTPNMEEVLANKEYKIGGSGGAGKGPGFYASLYEGGINTVYGKYVYKCRIPIENFLIFDEKVFRDLKSSHFKTEVSNIIKRWENKANSVFDEKAVNVIKDPETKERISTHIQKFKEKESLGFFGAQLLYFGIDEKDAKKYDGWFKGRKSKADFYNYLRKQTWFDRLRGVKVKGIIYSSGKDTTIISFFPQNVVVLGKAEDIRKPGEKVFNKHSGFKKLDKDIMLKQNKAKQTSFGDIKAPADEEYKLGQARKYEEKLEKEKKRKRWDNYYETKRTFK